MSTTAPQDPLAPEAAARLAEFARACKAATRIVAMYPASHPAIQAALGRIVDAGNRATADGPLAVTVLPDDLLVDGRALPRPDPAVADLAALLHAHLVGELTVGAGMSVDAWHAFLSIAARPPEEVRADGGLARAWMAAGGGPVDIKEIDYAHVLRERTGDGRPATWDRIIGACLDSGGDLDGEALGALHAIAEDPEQLAAFLARLQERARADGETGRHRVSILRLVQGLARHAARSSPASLDPILDNLAGAASRLSPDLLLALVAESSAGGADGPDVGAEIRARLDAEQLATFVASAVLRDEGATARLAQAFHALVPDAEQQELVLAGAARQVAAAIPDQPRFEQVWSSAVDLLTSYSDESFVSEAYARELGGARAQAAAVERLQDDPPERLSAWLSTVGGRELRYLDQQLLLDLLRIEARPDAWAGVLETTLARLHQLVLLGDLPLAHALLEAVVAVARTPDTPFHEEAARGLDRLARGELAGHVALAARKVSDQEMPLVTAFCQAVGPALVGPLAEALASEGDGRAVRRLRDVIIAFGADARAHVDELRSSPNPAVRRAAIDLLRAVAGNDALPDLRSLLDDAEPQVQRDALRAIVQLGTDEAYAALEQALGSGAARTRDTIMQALGSLRDERAAPLFVHILRHADHRGGFEPVYTSAIEALARFAGDHETLEALREVLYRGEWWAPFRTSRLRLAAATALRATGAAAAERVLTEAAAAGPRGVRRAARAALALPSPRPRREA
ncbi:MAG: HEAT repeat domain-containing protein [Vicinamibacterales bacterium]